MIRALLIVLLATPAMAHHEAIVVSAVPAVLPWICAAAVACLAIWRGWQGRK